MNIAVENISKSFGDKLVLERFSAALPIGDVSCVTGPSGVGKTTLMRILMGLEKPDSGAVTGLDGLCVSAVFQEDRLIEGVSAVRNAAIVLKGGHSRQRAKEELLALGLGERDVHVPVSSLSGGMRRRVAVARALLAKWDVLLLDEPFKGLDCSVKGKVIQHILGHRAGRTIIMVTHDMQEAQLMGAVVLRMGS